MSDRICTKCDGRGFDRVENKGIVTALTDIKRCSTCGGYGRVKDTPTIFYVAIAVLLAVGLFGWAVS